MWQVSASTDHEDLEYGLSNMIRVVIEAVPFGHVLRGQFLDAAEQLLVLELLVAEADQRFKRRLVAERVAAADLTTSPNMFA
jgi:hypothetical protein